MFHFRREYFHLLVGVGNNILGQHKFAISHFERAVELQAQEALAHKELALSYASMGLNHENLVRHWSSLVVYKNTDAGSISLK